MARNDKSSATSPELAALQRIEQQLMVITRILASEKLDAIASDPKQRMIYASAGRIPGGQLAKKAHVSLTTVSQLWQKWARQGLMVKDGKSYRPIV